MSIRVPSNVLVFTPVLRLETATVQAVFSLEWSGPLSVLFQRDNPTGDPVADHLHQYQTGRERFLAGPYNAMLVIESDIVPPADTLERLFALNCDVAYGCYMFRAGGVVNILEHYYDGAANPGESLTLRGLWGAAKESGVIRCSGSGLGCVLIQRHVIEETPFVASPHGVFFDSWWTKQAYSSGYTMLADTAVNCGHISPDGEVVYAH